MWCEGLPEGLYTRPAVPASSRRRSARPPRAERVERASAPAPGPSPPPANQPATGIALRFVSCGILSLCFGLLWKLTLAPHRVGTGSALLGILFLLLGFVVGGMLWYLRDVRLRTRDPALVPDERLVFSFIVFALVPFAVLGVVGLVWVVALVVGAR
ncbi:MAG: hypothetical protein QOE72_1248 [Chloroflexota bacterium]|nr:hypothetical protein [Chloroflexota bacterium]